MFSSPVSRARRARRQSSRLVLEPLEDRTVLNASLDPQSVLTAFGPTLSGLQNSLNNAPITSMPIIGSALGDLDFGRLSKGALSGLLGQDLYNAVAHHAFLTDKPLRDGSEQVTLQLHVQDSRQVPFALDLQLPIFSLSSQAQLDLTLGFSYTVGFTSHPDGTINIDAAGPNALALSATAALTSFHADGGLGLFGRVQADNHAPGSTSLSTTLTASPDVVTGDFSSLRLTGNAHLDWDLDLRVFDPAKVGANIPNPHLGAELLIDWNFDAGGAGTPLTGSAGPSFGKLSVSFPSVRLYVGELLPAFLQPILSKLKDATRPLAPVVEALDQRIPGLDQLGASFTLRDALNQLGALSPTVSQALDLIRFVNDQPDFSGGPSSQYINLGSFSLDDYRNQALGIGASAVQAAQGLLDQVDQISGGYVSQLTSALNLPAVNGVQPGFTFPLFTDPLKGAFQLILGQNPDLFTFQLPTIDLPLHGSLGFSGLVLGISLDASADIKIDLSAGYDTSGLRALVSHLTGPNPDGTSPFEDVLSGFYLDNRTLGPGAGESHHATGVDVTGDLKAVASLLGVNLSGGLHLDGSLSLNEQFNDAQGRFHLTPQVMHALGNDPLLLLHGRGQIATTLDVGYGISTPLGAVDFFSYHIADATLLDFDTLGHLPALPDPQDTTILLDVADGDQVIHVHNYEKQYVGTRAEGTFGLREFVRGIEVDYGYSMASLTDGGQEAIVSRRFYPVAHESFDSTTGAHKYESWGTCTLVGTSRLAAGGNHAILVDDSTALYDRTTDSRHFRGSVRGVQYNDPATGQYRIKYGLLGSKDGGTVNVVLAGGPGNDDLEYTGDGQAVLAGGGGDDRLVGGTLEAGGYLIPSGSGFLTPVQYASVTAPFALPPSLFFQIAPGYLLAEAAGGNDTLIGSVNNDTLVAGIGSAYFDGISGLDTEYGGNGNDQFRVRMGNSVTAYGGGGYNTLLLDSASGAAVASVISNNNSGIKDRLQPALRALSLIGTGSFVLAHDIQSLGVSTYGGSVEFDDLQSTTVRQVGVNRVVAGTQLPLDVRLDGSTGDDSFTLDTGATVRGVPSLLATISRADATAPLYVALPRLVYGDTITFAGGGGNDRYTIRPNRFWQFGINVVAAAAWNVSNTLDVNAAALAGSLDAVGIGITDNTVTLASSYGRRGKPSELAKVSVSFTGITDLSVEAPDNVAGNRITLAQVLSNPGQGQSSSLYQTTVTGGAYDDTFEVVGYNDLLTLNGRGGNDAFNVHTFYGTMTVNGGSGSNSFTLGNNGDASRCKAQFDVHDPLGLISVAVDDSNDSYARDITVAPTSLSWAYGLVSHVVNYVANELSALTFAGSPGTTFLVQDTPHHTYGVAASDVTTALTTRGFYLPYVTVRATTGSLQVTAVNGSADVFLGDAGGLSRIKAPVTVSGPATLVADDSARASLPHEVVIDAAGDSYMEASGLAPAPLFWEAARTTARLGTGNAGSGNHFTIRATGGSTDVLVPGGSVDVLGTNGGLAVHYAAQVRLGLGNAQGLRGSIQVSSPWDLFVAPCTVTVDDTGDAGARTAGLTWDPKNYLSLLSGLAPAPIALAGSVAALEIDGGSGGNVFRIDQPYPALTLNPGAGSDTVVVAATQTPLRINAGSLGLGGDDVIQLGLQADGTATTAKLKGAISARGAYVGVFDGDDPTPRTITVTNGTVSGLSPAPITYQAASTKVLYLAGGKGGNTWTIADPGPVQYDTQVVAGAGNDVVNLQASETGVLLNGQAGQDQFNLSGDFFASLTGIRAWVVAFSTSGTVALNLDYSDEHSGRTVQVGDNSTVPGATATSIVGSGAGPIDYIVDPTGRTGVTSIRITSGAGNDTFRLTGDLGVNLALDGNGGTDTVVGGNISNVWQVTGSGAGSLNGRTTFRGIANLTGGTADDRFVFASAASLSGRIDGQAGSDTLDYSGFAGDVTVNLTLGTATRVGRGVVNVENALGGLGNSVLIGDANNNRLVGGAGRNLIVGGGGADVIVGGGGDNLLIGCTTDYDANPAAIDLIMREWSQPTAFAARVDNILRGRGLLAWTGIALNPTTVHGDQASDVLTPGAGNNWYFLDQADPPIVNPHANDRQTRV